MIRSAKTCAAILTLSLIQAAAAAAADFSAPSVVPVQLPELAVCALPAAGLAPNAGPALAGAIVASQPIEAAQSAQALQSYAQARQDLAYVAEKTGIVASLPVVSEVLKAWLIGRAADKKVVFSDYDDTLDAFSAVASPETVAAISVVSAAGKRMVIVSDRADTKREGSKSVTILESLSSIPAPQRAGLIVAANKGGRILSYGADGEAKLIYEEPPMPQVELSKVKEAVEIVKTKLSGLGVDLHDGSKNIPAETYGPYHYGMMLKIGTGEAAVRVAAEALQGELAVRGLDYEVEPRFAKDPANPPYITFSKLDKSLAVRHIAEMLKTEAKDALILGDSMFMPKWAKPAEVSAELAQAAARAGVDLRNPPTQLTGNAVDRSMERALPEALTLSVGGTADPRMANGFVMPGKGPEVTREILKAVAALDLAELAARSASKTGLRGPQLIAVQAAIGGGNSAASWTLTYADSATGGILAKTREFAELTVTPDGTVISLKSETKKGGILSAPKIVELKIDPTAATLGQALARARKDYPDMIVERAESAVEVDGYESPGMGMYDPPEYSSWDVPVWRFSGHSVEAPGVQIVQSYDARKLLWRRQSSKFIEPPRQELELLAADSPVWVSASLVLYPPYTHSQSRLDAMRDAVLKEFKAQRWQMLDPQPEIYTPSPTWRMRISAADYRRLREASHIYHVAPTFEYVGASGEGG